MWLMGILLCFAATLPTGAFVPKITKPEESASPKLVIFVSHIVKRTCQYAATPQPALELLDTSFLAA